MRAACWTEPSDPSAYMHKESAFAQRIILTNAKVVPFSSGETPGSSLNVAPIILQLTPTLNEHQKRGNLALLRSIWH